MGSIRQNPADFARGQQQKPFRAHERFSGKFSKDFTLNSNRRQDARNVDSDLVFMAVCRCSASAPPADPVFSFTHFKATEGTETETGGGGEIGDPAAKMSSHTCWFAPRYFGAAVIF